jgi:hypothetical protein
MGVWAEGEMGARAERETWARLRERERTELGFSVFIYCETLLGLDGPGGLAAIFGGGSYRVPTFVNRLIEADNIRRPPLLISIKLRRLF